MQQSQQEAINAKINTARKLSKRVSAELSPRMRWQDAEANLWDAIKLSRKVSAEKDGLWLAMTAQALKGSAMLQWVCISQWSKPVEAPESPWRVGKGRKCLAEEMA